MRKFAILSILLVLSSSTAYAAGLETLEFPNGRKVGQIDKVSCYLEVGGELKHFSQNERKEHANKMAVDCKLVYDEKTLEVAAGSQGVTRSARWYEKSEGSVQNGELSNKITLRDGCKLIAMEAGDQRPVLFSPKEKLNAEELEMIEIPGNSLLLDCLLPEKAVAAGDSWRLSEQAAAQFFALLEVGQSDVQCTLKEVTDKVARFEMSGTVTGMAEGTSAEIEVKARYRYDRRRNRVDWLGMLIKEKRNVTEVSDGLDVVARVQTTILPQADSAKLSDASLKDVSFQSTPESLLLEHRSKKESWKLLYDRAWQLSIDVYEKDIAEFHRFDKSSHIAHCKITPLLPTEPGKLVGLDAFQGELKEKLDKEFGGFVDADETTTPEKYRILRTAIQGKASDVPMHWIYYHISDPAGHQAVIYFIMEEKNIERFGDADKKLVESFRFTEEKK